MTVKQPIENLLPRAGWSVYKLVRLASMRAQELAEGKPKLVEALSTDKTTTVALEEILQGKVMTKEAAKQADNGALETKTVAGKK